MGHFLYDWFNIKALGGVASIFAMLLMFRSMEDEMLAVGGRVNEFTLRLCVCFHNSSETTGGSGGSIDTRTECVIGSQGGGGLGLDHRSCPYQLNMTQLALSVDRCEQGARSVSDRSS